MLPPDQRLICGKLDCVGGDRGACCVEPSVLREGGMHGAIMLITPITLMLLLPSRHTIVQPVTS